MSGNRGDKGGSGSDDELKAELLARLGQLSYRELLTMTLNMALGPRTAPTEVRDSRPRSATPAARSAADKPTTDGPVDWTRVMATCPKCGRTGPVLPDFGISRRRTGSERAQSWCRKCRKSGDPAAR